MDKTLFTEWFNEYSDFMSYEDYLFRRNASRQAHSIPGGLCPRCRSPIDEVWRCYWSLTGMCKDCKSPISPDELPIKTYIMDEIKNVRALIKQKEAEQDKKTPPPANRPFA